MIAINLSINWGALYPINLHLSITKHLVHYLTWCPHYLLINANNFTDRLETVPWGSAQKPAPNPPLLRNCSSSTYNVLIQCCLLHQRSHWGYCSTYQGSPFMDNPLKTQNSITKGQLCNPLPYMSTSHSSYVHRWKYPLRWSICVIIP